MGSTLTLTYKTLQAPGNNRRLNCVCSVCFVSTTVIDVFFYCLISCPTSLYLVVIDVSARARDPGKDGP